MKHAKANNETAWEVASAGTYADICAPRGVMAVVLVVALAMAVLPAIGMLWARTDSTTENRELAEAPVLFDESGAFNVNVLADAGTYFDDHFAYRNALVSANARIRAAFGTSSTDQVVVGSQGWLFYGGTLPDYLGQSALSDRALRNIAHNLALARSYAEAQGATFLFTIAPNKNTLYSQYMPGYYLRSSQDSNAERLKPLLEEAGVGYLDLFDLLERAGEGPQAGRGTSDAAVSDGSQAPTSWYLKQDSHWNNEGALMAARELLESAGQEMPAIQPGSGKPRDDFEGDLEAMLYPQGAKTEVNWYFEGVNDGPGMSGEEWTYVEGGDVTDSWVRTERKGSGESAEGNADVEPSSLLMFRDSFGNALLPLLASSFDKAAFSKLIPYNLTAISQVGARSVVVERAERHIDYLAKNPPIMPAPRVSLGFELPLDESADGAATTLSATVDGPYWKLEGIAAGSCLEDASKIYVSVEADGAQSSVYEASWKSVEAPSLSGESTQTGGNSESTSSASEASDFGYQVYLPKDVIDLSSAKIRVYAVTDGSATCLRAFGNPLEIE